LIFRDFSCLSTELNRFTAFFSIVIFLVAAVGIPLPIVTKKDRSVPFPCMDRACGCRSAAECKQHCCCFSNAEKVAWARQHGHDPDTVASCATPQDSADSTQGSCCATKNTPKSCPHCRTTKLGRAGVSAQKDSLQKVSPQKDTHGIEVLISSFERRCQGGDNFWMVLSTAMIPPPSVFLAIPDRVILVLGIPTLPAYSLEATGPPVPPPEDESSLPISS
jgi:hypothetical protein